MLRRTMLRFMCNDDTFAGGGGGGEYLGNFMIAFVVAKMLRMWHSICCRPSPIMNPGLQMIPLMKQIRSS